MPALPLIISLSEELDDLHEVGERLYRNTRPRFYRPRRVHNFQHLHQHPPMPFVIPAFNRIEKVKKDEVAAAVAGPSNVGKDGFQVCMDVQQFKPSELMVKTVDNAVVVEGKHEEREDEHGSISRHFVRRYVLPEGYDPKQVVSTLSSDGVLTVKVPPPPRAEGPNERIVQIQHTGPAHLSVKENASEEQQQEEKEKKEEK